jgi:site-specific DNA-cytosine methylase
MTAGFPCQAFSIGGKKQGFEDERGELIFHLFRIIETKLPKVILSENVKNFCTGEGALTPRERARLQGFPDTFKPHPVKTHANKQFGNSVAVPVIKALGQAIANQFFSQAA